MKIIKICRKYKIDFKGLDYWRIFLYNTEIRQFFGNHIYYHDYPYAKKFFGDNSYGLYAETIEIINIINNNYISCFDDNLIYQINMFINNFQIDAV